MRLKNMKKNNQYWFNNSIAIISQTIIEELKKNKELKTDYISLSIKKLKNDKDEKLKKILTNSLNIINKLNMLKNLQENKINNCKLCNLYKSRLNIVFGSGNPEAKLVFIGEAPGIDEDICGKPFVGRSGNLLTKMIEAMEFKRSDVYICNVVKCRPPNNRNPEIHEIATCEVFLKDQLRIIQPKVLVALGSYAYKSLIKTSKSISEARGIWVNYNKILLMPTFHPAYLLRNNNKKKYVWKDLQNVMKILN